MACNMLLTGATRIAATSLCPDDEVFSAVQFPTTTVMMTGALTVSTG